MKRIGRYLRKAPVDPRPGELLCYTDADWASDKTSRRSMSGGVVTLGGGVLNCWEKKQKSVALSSLENELFAAITSGTRFWGIQSELTDLGYSCSVTVVTDSQSVVDHSKAPKSQRCVKARWSEKTLVARSSSGRETGA